MFILLWSLYRIRKYHLRKGTWRHKACLFYVHLVVFITMTIVEVVSLYPIIAQDKAITHTGSNFLDGLTIIYNLVNAVATLFMLILIWQMTQKHHEVHQPID